MLLSKEKAEELRNQRIGEIRFNNNGEKMKIIEYINNRNITIQFEDGHVVTAEYCNFKKGSIKNPYTKAIFHIGFFGEGKYKSKINGKRTRSYHIWKGMLERCYNDKCHIKNPTYKGCTVCNEWHNYQNFAKWYDENYYEIDNEIMAIDKDILHKGNKIYSPKNCIFVPQNINTLFIKCDSRRGNLPLGVCWNKASNKYQVYCNDGSKKNIYLGLFNTILEAFNTYKKYKEQLIKEIADTYKDKIPKKLYDAMYAYIVEITD